MSPPSSTNYHNKNQCFAMYSALLFMLTMFNYRVYYIISKHLILIGCSYISVSFYIKLRQAVRTLLGNNEKLCYKVFIKHI